jgi:hypothetical protein
MSNNSTTTGRGSGGRHTAGAYDVRTVIGALIGFFGLVLIVMGLVNNSGADLQKAGGVNANLWTGIAMVVVAVLFGLWTWLRPVVVDEGPSVDDAEDLNRANR